MENSLLDVLLGRPKPVVKLVIGKSVEFRILTNGERGEILRNNPTANPLAAPEIIATPTLAKAIVSIDGIRWKDFQDVQELMNIRKESPIEVVVAEYLASTFPFPVIQELYLAYLDVVNDYYNQIDALKKTSPEQNQELSGKSAKSSNKTP